MKKTYEWVGVSKLSSDTVLFDINIVYYFILTVFYVAVVI